MPPPDDQSPAPDAAAGGPRTGSAGDTPREPAPGARGGGVPVDDPPDPDELLRQRDDYYDRLRRLTAEFDNFRKRTDRERRELSEHAARDLLTDLLPIVDDLERALAADSDDGGAYRRGVELIHKQMLELLSRHGVTRIEAVGADFDPNLHQAVAHEPSETHRDGEVIEELRRGYTLRDRLLRAAMVKVAKA